MMSLFLHLALALYLAMSLALLAALIMRARIRTREDRLDTFGSRVSGRSRDRGAPMPSGSCP